MTATPVAEATLPEVIRFFEGLSPADLARIGEIYGPDAWFRDPFSEVRGPAEIARIFSHMFERLDAPRFVILETMTQGDQAFLVWDFEFRFRPGSPAAAETIRGSSHLRFDAQGRIVSHRDYWDAADLYAKLPVIGALMRWLKRRAAG